MTAATTSAARPAARAARLFIGVVANAAAASAIPDVDADAAARWRGGRGRGAGAGRGRSGARHGHREVARRPVAGLDDEVQGTALLGEVALLAGRRGDEARRVR